MRFAYIDSNGNEVPIPSVDALGLRIELGAITDETQLYDAQADQWGPAHSHEIFHSLARTAGGDGGFVAPPPAAPRPVAPPPAAPRRAASPPDARATAKTAVATEPPKTEKPSKKAPGKPGERETPTAADFGLTLAPEPPSEDADDGVDPIDTPGAGLTLAAPNSGFGDAEAASDARIDRKRSTEGDEGGTTPETAPAVEAVGEDGGKRADASGAADEPDAGGFDFGDLDGGLEVEEPTDTPNDDVMDLAAISDGPGLGSDASVETSLQFGAGDFTLDDGQMLDLEAPLYEFDPDSPPAWMEQDGPAGVGADDEDVMDFSSVTKGGPDEAVGTATKSEVKPKTPSRPSKPRRRRQPRNMAGPMIATIAFLAVALGGYVAWPLVSAKLNTPNEPVVVTGVRLPAIPPELEPQMRSIADAALAAAFADVRRAWSESDPVDAPHRDWLGGLYLANASAYDDVQVFWDGMQDRLEGVRDIDLATFDAAFATEAAGRDASAENVAIMRARADSGFVAGANARDVTYDRLQTLIDSAIRLHQFLVANEANIQYAPASSVTTDPVLEARSTPEVREAMEDLIDAVTRALGALEYRDQVTAEGLWHRALTIVQESGIA